MEKGRRGRDLIKFLFTGNYIRVGRNNANAFVHILVVMSHNMTANFKITDQNINYKICWIIYLISAWKSRCFLITHSSRWKSKKPIFLVRLALFVLYLHHKSALILSCRHVLFEKRQLAKPYCHSGLDIFCVLNHFIKLSVQVTTDCHIPLWTYVIYFMNFT